MPTKTPPRDERARPETPLSRRLALGALLAGIFLVLALVAIRRPASNPMGVPQPTRSWSLVIVPFDGAAGPGTNAAAGWVHEALAHRLDGVEALVVRAGSEPLDPDAWAASVREAGRRHASRYLLEGTVRPLEGEEQRIRFTPRLARTADAMVLWSERYDLTLGEDAPFEQMGRAILDAIGHEAPSR